MAKKSSEPVANAIIGAIEPIIEPVVGDGIVTGNGSDVDGGANSDIGGIPIVQPVAAGGDIRRTRGRPVGSGKSKPTSASRRGEKAAPISVKGIEKILYSMHAMAASAFSTPELSLDAQEAAHLSAAVTDVASFYNATLDPKITAWVGLFGVLGMVYGPRIASYKLRKQMETLTQKKPENAQQQTVAQTQTLNGAPINLSDPSFVSMPSH